MWVVRHRTATELQVDNQTLGALMVEIHRSGRAMKVLATMAVQALELRKGLAVVQTEGKLMNSRSKSRLVRKMTSEHLAGIAAYWRAQMDKELRNALGG